MLRSYQYSAIEALREQLAELQAPQIAHGRRAIILFEGPMGAGKKAALRQLAAAFDPCHLTVHSTEYERREASDGHWLARFWRQLPIAGNTSVFFRSWYRRVLDGEEYLVVLNLTHRPVRTAARPAGAELLLANGGEARDLDAYGAQLWRVS